MYRKIFSKVKTLNILKIPLLFPIKLGINKSTRNTYKTLFWSSTKKLAIISKFPKNIRPIIG